MFLVLRCGQNCSILVWPPQRPCDLHLTKTKIYLPKLPSMLNLKSIRPLGGCFTAPPVQRTGLCYPPFKKQRDDSLCPSESWSMLWSVSTCATIVTSTHHHGIPGKDYKSLHPMVNPSLYLTNIHTINIHWQSFTILLFEPFP